MGVYKRKKEVVREETMIVIALPGVVEPQGVIQEVGIGAMPELLREDETGRG